MCFESDFHLRYPSDVRLLARDSLTAMGGWDRVWVDPGHRDGGVRMYGFVFANKHECCVY